MFRLIRRVYAEFIQSRKLGNELPSLTFSFNPMKTIEKFRSKLSLGLIIQAIILSITILFSFYIMPLSIWGKLLLFLGLLAIVTVPILAQFFGYGLPVLGWVFLFFTSRYIPLGLKRPITVTVLPAVETIFYGDNLSQVLASYTCTLLDLFAWLPYGIVHFALPFFVAGFIWLFAPPKTLRSFGWAFGYMNLVGVIIQDLLFPAAPPWYKVLHGLEKANYTMSGSPGGLGRIDKILGFDLYTSNFSNSPLIFGAMPSLHSACATMDCLWLCYLFPRWRPLWYCYVLWLWFSTMYLTHHYFVDLVAGSCLALTFFGWVLIDGRLPINDKLCRWSYTDIKYHDPVASDPLLPEAGDSFAMEPLDDSAFVIDDDDDDEIREEPSNIELSLPNHGSKKVSIEEQRLIG